MGMLSKAVVAPLKLYRLVVSPLYGQTCRYYPSCSAYAVGAIEQLGAIRGLWLAMRRLGRCHPWCEGGVDLVPTVETYRWWGRAAGTDGEDDPADEFVTERDAGPRPLQPSPNGNCPTQSHELIGA